MDADRHHNLLHLRPRRGPSSVLLWVVVFLLVEPIACHWVCQRAPHSHRSVHLIVQPTADSGDAATFVALPQVRAWICLFGDPLTPDNSPQPEGTITSLHDHHAIADVLPAILAMILLLVTITPIALRPGDGIVARIDRPPMARC